MWWTLYRHLKYECIKYLWTFEAFMGVRREIRLSPRVVSFLDELTSSWVDCFQDEFKFDSPFRPAIMGIRWWKRVEENNFFSTARRLKSENIHPWHRSNSFPPGCGRETLIELRWPSGKWNDKEAEKSRDACAHFADIFRRRMDGSAGIRLTVMKLFWRENVSPGNTLH